MTAKRYVSTVDTTGFDTAMFKRLKVGQWVMIMGELKGQYLGITQAGVTVINYKKAPTMKRQFAANRPLRQFAKLMGSI